MESRLVGNQRDHSKHDEFFGMNQDVRKTRRAAMSRMPQGILAVSLLAVASSCGNPGRRAELVQQTDTLRRENQRLERLVSDRDGAIALLDRQIVNLQTFEANRPANLFAPVKLEIASLSGGADYDDRPGDDGVTVYLRPRDTDGHIVKAPGAIRVQLLDNSDLNNPRVIGVYDFTDPETIRKSWYGKFGTSHYTLKCPFPDACSRATT